ncbi:hypothetical protein JHW43_006322 [Diplocarpon mali]|nr:hypothetical protein JHW43_006322 [Diplocarpon mali]
MRKTPGFSFWRSLQWKICLASLTVNALYLGFLTYSREGKLSPSMPVESRRPSVVLRQGSFLGVELDDDYPQVLDAFLGIPYGLSTEGLGRFSLPVRVDDSKMVFDAGTYGNRCLSISGGPKQSEDCLKLDLYRPKVRIPGEKLPVLVDFHGGAFNGGVGDSSKMLSYMAAWSAKPLIAVSFSYRVGAFGFLPSTVMAKEGLLNLGLKDQELLLEWIQENIAAFGGDPKNVTLRGSSAGAHSVRSLRLKSLPFTAAAVFLYPLTPFLGKHAHGQADLLRWLQIRKLHFSPLYYHQPTKELQVGHHLMHNTDKPPPFARAILESGAATARAVYHYSNTLHRLQFREFLRELGCSSVPESRLLTKLRGYSAAEIQAASAKVFNKAQNSLKWPFQPVIEGEGGFIPISPIEAWKAGKWHKVPILTGYNTNDGAMFVPKNAETNDNFISFFVDLLPSLGSKDILELERVYPDPTKKARSKYKETRPGLGAQFKRLEQAYGHFAYIAPVRQTVHFASAGPSPIYLYQFAASSSVNGGADHGTHMPWVAHVPGLKKKSKTVDTISGMMNAYWTSFVTSGDPNLVPGRYPGRKKWPAYERSERKGVGRQGGEEQLLVFGEGNDEVAGGETKGIAVQSKGDRFAAEESEFWWNRTELFES